jgi:hypothetical protein
VKGSESGCEVWEARGKRGKGEECEEENWEEGYKCEDLVGGVEGFGLQRFVSSSSSSPSS